MNGSRSKIRLANKEQRKLHKRGTTILSSLGGLCAKQHGTTSTVGYLPGAYLLWYRLPLAWLIIGIGIGIGIGCWMLIHVFLICWSYFYWNRIEWNRDLWHFFCWNSDILNKSNVLIEVLIKSSLSSSASLRMALDWSYTTNKYQYNYNNNIESVPRPRESSDHRPNPTSHPQLDNMNIYHIRSIHTRCGHESPSTY